MLRGEMNGLDDDLWLTRRSLVQRLARMGAVVVLLSPGGAFSSCKKDPPQPAVGARTSRHRTFTNDEFESMAAACDRILPKDQDPGALEANVPEFVDRM